MECDNNRPTVNSQFHKRKRKLLQQLINGFSLDITPKKIKTEENSPQLCVDKPIFAITVDTEFCLICGVKGLLRIVSENEVRILKQQNICTGIMEASICTVCENYVQDFVKLNDKLQRLAIKVAELSTILRTVISVQDSNENCQMLVDECNIEDWGGSEIPQPINIAEIVQKFDSEDESTIFPCEDLDLQLTEDNSDSEDNGNVGETNAMKHLPQEAVTNGTMISVLVQSKPKKDNRKDQISSRKLRKHAGSAKEPTSKVQSLLNLSCSICAKTFPTKWKLGRHELTHKIQVPRNTDVSNPLEISVEMETQPIEPVLNVFSEPGHENLTLDSNLCSLSIIESGSVFEETTENNINTCETTSLQSESTVLIPSTTKERPKRQSRLKAQEKLKTIEEQDNSEEAKSDSDFGEEISSTTDSESDKDIESEEDGQDSFENIEIDKEERFPCPICKRTFARKQCMKRHMARHEFQSKTEQLKCDECKETWTRRSLQEHHRLSHKGGSDEGLYNCDFCGKKFLSEQGCETHREIFHSATGEGTNCCYNCKTSFNNSENLETHYSECVGNLCHPCKILVPQEKWETHLETWTHIMEKEIISVIEKKDTEGNLICRFCKDLNKFQKEEAFRSHLKECHGNKGKFFCKPCEQDYLCWKNYKHHVKKSERHARNVVAAENCGIPQAEVEEMLPFACSHCTKRFKTSETCHRHEGMHTRDSFQKPSVCEICGKLFQTLPGLVVHRLKGHPETKQRNLKKRKVELGIFKCSQCPKNFTRKRYLTLHIARKHEVTKKYDCDICGKSYTNKLAVHHHKVTKHNGDGGKKEKEKFECPVPSCRKQSSKQYLFSHMEVHHRKGTDAEFTKICPYECGWENGTEEEEDWIKHVEICCKDKEQKDVSCRRCVKTFPSVFLRFLHFTKEHPAFSYPCTFCPRVYSQGTALIWHKASHTEIKSFQCTKCGKSFPQANNLKIHLNSVCAEDEEVRKAFVAKRKEKHKEFMEKKKPWKCSNCGKGFVEERRMIAHKNAAHKEESESE